MPLKRNLDSITQKGRNTSSGSSTRIQRPMMIKPWAENAGTGNSGTVWVSMKPKKIIDQYSKGAGTFATIDLQEEFLFLAPLAVNESISHFWEAYESVASRLAQKVRSATKLTAEIAGITNVFGENADLADSVSDVFSKSANNVGSTIENVTRKMYNATGSSRVPSIKVDTPLYYENSERRSLMMEFQLFHENICSNPRDVLIEPIQKLMKYSSPDHKGGIDIEFPYMWEVKTVPISFINYTTCALTAVQPVWNSPYIEGLPSSCNLTLTFKDLSPVYREIWDKKGTVINIISSNKTEAAKAQGQAPVSEYSSIQRKKI